MTYDGALTVFRLAPFRRFDARGRLASCWRDARVAWKHGLGLTIGLALAWLATGVGAQALDLPAIQEKGVIRIALYKDYPPYSANNAGIDLDLAQALAAKLKVRLDPLWFSADEEVDDDLRNMVWKGHYLGTGPADALIHAPVDPELGRRNPQVKLIAPYFRDRLQIVRDLSKLPRLDDMRALNDAVVGVEEASLASIVMVSFEGGRLRDRVRHFKTPALAIEAMKRGEVSAVLAQQGEVQGLTRGAGDYAVGPLPVTGGLATRQWVLGMAVKSNHAALGNALSAAMTELMAEGEVERIFQRHGVTHVRP